MDTEATTVGKRKNAADEIRERQIMRKGALMVAEGKMTDKEISVKLGIQPGTLRTWKKSPMFVEMVSQFADRIIDEGVSSIVDEIMADAPRNISFLKNVRDGVEVDDPKSLSIRLRAAEVLFDRQVPKQQQAVDNAVQVIISGRLVDQMMRAMRSDGATIDAEFEEIDDGKLRVRGPKTPEEFAARYTPPQIATDDEDDDE